ncbi:hypothetical protein AUR64_15370 [Haloprofundus marisrubri]|uniref:DUF8135 domain-containing protein n=1 Tax=Haloprofundus marisrubri TaxID=1514971 RepID=A0A0W1R867_9EURY|nr:hypothetical protein [Haloprofundus marisrubri]KTG09172.1 hypothetical protein AUR64_15370 [Haloprofundus marisrubri]
MSEESADDGERDGETTDSAPAVDPFEQLADADADTPSTGTTETDVSDPWAELEASDAVASDGVDTGKFEFADAGTAEFDFSTVDEWANSVDDGDTTFDAPNDEQTPAAEAVEADEGETYVVSKRHYCQTCPHFESPPNFGCTHEGTDIVETVSFERFRVRNCPMVDDESDAGSSRRAAHAVADVSGTSSRGDEEANGSD